MELQAKKAAEEVMDLNISQMTSEFSIYAGNN